MSGLVEKLWYPDQETWGRKVALSPLLLGEAAFRGGAALRDALYRASLLPTIRVEGAKVISVGNLNVGGAGKTPLTVLLARELVGRGERVAVLSRGYGRRSRAPVQFSGAGPHPSAELAGDEPLLIARRCPEAQLFVGADRVASARAAIAAGATTLLLDDGFQHRRLARDVDIVVIDGAARFGNGHLLPRGPLREPPSALRRATLVCWRLDEDASPPTDALPAPAFSARFAPVGWRRPDGTNAEPAALAAQEVVVLTAIARPASFVRTVERLGVTVRRVHAFADHHLFAPAELDAIRADAAGRPVITTEKDRVRLPGSFPAWTLEMELRVVSGHAQLEAALAR